MVKFRSRGNVAEPARYISLYLRVPGRVLKGKSVMQKEFPQCPDDIVFKGPSKPFRYVVLEDRNKLLVGWWDYGSKIQLGDGDTLTVEFKDPII